MKKSNNSFTTSWGYSNQQPAPNPAYSGGGGGSSVAMSMTPDYAVADGSLSASVGGEIDINYVNNDQRSFGLGERANNSTFIIRDNSVTWDKLLLEFVMGYGPEYSGFGPNHPMTIQVKNSWVVFQARLKFIANNAKKLAYYDVPFGLPGIPLSNVNTTAQFLGGVRVSISQTAIGTLFVVNNTTGAYSGGYHFVSDFPRHPVENTPFGNIYQRFMWVE